MGKSSGKNSGKRRQRELGKGGKKWEKTIVKVKNRWGKTVGKEDNESWGKVETKWEKTMIRVGKRVKKVCES